MDYKDKIRKLLALAESLSEHEAKAALLKARQLMAEHKLRPEDIEPAKNKKLINREIDVTCTKQKGAWKSPFLPQSRRRTAARRFAGINTARGRTVSVLSGSRTTLTSA